MPSAPPSPSPSCPFCGIASSHSPWPPSHPPATQNSNSNPSTGAPQSHVILSTKHVLAFLDIMPLTRGHVLVVPRRHLENLGQSGVRAAGEVGKWLPVLSRVVVRTILGTEPDERGQDPGHWNVVQNNGTRAAQTVPHVHFHIIPRPPLDSSNNRSTGGWLLFGRGQRDELDDDDAEELIRQLRADLATEVARIKEEEGIDLDMDEDFDEGDIYKPRRLERL